MKAIQVIGPEMARLVELPLPEPVAGEVAIRVEAVGICGTDLEIIGGNMAYYTAGLARYPVVIGHEWVGEVAALGEGVAGLAVGDRVVGEVSIGCMTCPTCRSGAYHRCPRRTETGVMNRDGGMAERVVLPAWAVHRVARTVDLRSAALVEPTAIAYNAVRLATVGPESRVAVVGDGPIGLLLLQVARAKGARHVVVIGADYRRMALARQLGALAVVDARMGRSVDAVRDAMGGEAPDVVLEASGTSAGVEAAVAVAAPGAIVVLQGLMGQLPDRALDLDHVVVNDLTLRGALGSPGIWPEVIALIEEGHVDPSTIVTHDRPLSDYAEVLEEVRSRRAVKALLRPDHG
jgi:2-desacetyl-2-hydroxyethyl bacteriochlorophyllide A dehydrogenase